MGGNIIIKKKIYISGKITGTTDYMIRFADAERELIMKGYSVINPAKVNAQLPSDTTYDEYMQMSITMLSMADSIYMLKDWQDSNGAKIEHQIATMLKIDILFE